MDFLLKPISAPRLMVLVMSINTFVFIPTTCPYNKVEANKQTNKNSFLLFSIMRGRFCFVLVQR